MLMNEIIFSKCSKPWFCVKVPFWAPFAAGVVKPPDDKTGCSNTYHKQIIRHWEGRNEEQEMNTWVKEY